jgi:Flp pilus assembly protein TadD
VLSLFVGGPAELAAYAGSAPVFTDDRMTLEFSAPRELHRRLGGENGATLAALLADGGGPAIIRASRTSATAANWRLRGNMMWKADMHALAYDDYVKALTADPSDSGALDGLVRVAIADRRGSDALAWIKSLSENRPATVEILVAQSRLLAAVEARPEALEKANNAIRLDRKNPKALEQLASLYADAGDVAALEGLVSALHDAAPNGAAGFYYQAAARLLKNDSAGAVEAAKRAIVADPKYTATYDLLGAACTKLNQPEEARQAFLKSLTFDAHDSAAYTNLGLIDLEVGDRAAAANHFAEALWLAPESKTAREGLAQARARFDFAQGKR